MQHVRGRRDFVRLGTRESHAVEVEDGVHCASQVLGAGKLVRVGDLGSGLLALGHGLPLAVEGLNVGEDLRLNVIAHVELEIFEGVVFRRVGVGVVGVADGKFETEVEGTEGHGAFVLVEDEIAAASGSALDVRGGDRELGFEVHLFDISFRNSANHHLTVHRVLNAELQNQVAAVDVLDAGHDVFTISLGEKHWFGAEHGLAELADLGDLAHLVLESKHLDRWAVRFDRRVLAVSGTGGGEVGSGGSLGGLSADDGEIFSGSCVDSLAGDLGFAGLGGGVLSLLVHGLLNIENERAHNVLIARSEDLAVQDGAVTDFIVDVSGAALEEWDDALTKSDTASADLG